MEEGYANANALVSKWRLMSIGKLMAGAAKSALSHNAAVFDKAQVAGAAAHLLSAAKRYAHLEEGSFPKCLEKAEAFLRHYHSNHTFPPPPPESMLRGGWVRRPRHGGEGHASGGARDYVNELSERHPSGICVPTRHKVTEDMQTFGGLMRATGYDTWQFGPKGARN